MGTSKRLAQATDTDTMPRSLDYPIHSVQYYQEDKSLIEELARLVGTSLVSGDAARWSRPNPIAMH